MFLFRSPSALQVNLALLVLRVVAGLSMAAHGWQKIFVIGMSVMTENFGKMGIPMAGLLGPAISILELVGGVLVALGLLTRLVSLVLVIDMLGAIFLVHIANGFFAPKGVELALLFCAMFATLTLTGAGTYAIDAALDKQNTN